MFWNSKKGSVERFLEAVKMVAGGGFEPPAFGL